MRVHARSGPEGATSRRVGTGLLLSCALLALAACGEKTAGAAKKSDVPAYQGSTGASAFSANGWKAGDQTAWEQQLRARAQSQNEYVRAAAQR